MRPTTITAFCAPLLLLAACGGDEELATEEGGDAAGEVLEGTISDDMIALDTLQSQPPLVVNEPQAAGPESEGTDPAAPAPAQEDAADDGEADSDAEPAAAEADEPAED